MSVVKEVSVKFTREGVHQWLDAPRHRDYLARPHRHLFHVKVTTIVIHSEREVEFHDLLEFSRGSFTVYPTWSCEKAAEHLCDCVKRWLPNDRMVRVECWEDGECGASVTYQPET